MCNPFEKAQLRDRVECLIYGKGRITLYDDFHNKITVTFGTTHTFHYTMDGRLNTIANRSLFYLDKNDKMCDDRPEPKMKYPYYVKSNMDNIFKVLHDGENKNLLLVQSYSDVGKMFTSHSKEWVVKTWTEEEYKKEFPVPCDKVPVDTKVYCIDNLNRIDKRYYAGNNSVFHLGSNSWSSNNFTTPFKNWVRVELAEDIIIDNVLYEAYQLEG